jgi:hypothetical protein
MTNAILMVLTTVLLGVSSSLQFAAERTIGSTTSSSFLGKKTRISRFDVTVGLSCLGVVAVTFSNFSWSLVTWALAHVGIILASWKGWNMSPNLHVESPKAVQNRLIQLRQQLDKLREKEQLDGILNKTAISHHAMSLFSERFELILMTIENHLLVGDHEQAEQIITSFARHLRQILYEGHTPFLPLADSIEHVQTQLTLMEKLTGARFCCDIDDGMLDDATRSRYTQPLQISAWVQEALWPYFSLAERSLEPVGNSIVSFDLEGSQLVVSFTPPQSMYLPEEPSGKHIRNAFRILGHAHVMKQTIPSSVFIAAG